MSSVPQFKATLDQILGSINELKRGSISAQYGTVLGVSPLQVSLDDDPATPLNGVPVSLVSGLVVGDRVWTVSFRSRVIVVGRVGGDAPHATGWRDAGGTLGPGVTSYAPLEYRILNGVVFWRGQVYRSGDWTSGTNTVISGVDPAARPSRGMPLTVSHDVGNLSTYIDVDGTIRLYSIGGTSKAWPILGGSYPVG